MLNPLSIFKIIQLSTNRIQAGLDAVSDHVKTKKMTLMKIMASFKFN